jgi:hypothetical protein
MVNVISALPGDVRLRLTSTEIWVRLCPVGGRLMYPPDLTRNGFHILSQMKLVKAAMEGR